MKTNGKLSWILSNSVFRNGLTFLLILSLAFQLNAQSDGLPRGAYQMPYVRYESEDANRGGGAILYENPFFDELLTAAEASDQKYVGLPNNGAYVEWNINNTANGITLRFTMPDAADGEGESGSLDLYVNNAFVKTINLTSYWAWQYFPGSEPENHPGDRPRMRFDEVHFLLNTPVGPGDVLKIQKGAGDSFEYGVDFIEIENVGAPLSKPSGYFSVTDYGAVPDDGNDDFAAFNAALAAAGSAGTGVYIPAGRFELSDKWSVEENNIGILGAGMWHTELFFSTEAVFSGGILARASDIEIGHFYMNTINNQRFLNGQYVIYKGFMGTYGNNSSIHDVWVTHFECGAWIAGYDPPYPIDITYNLEFTRNRIRNNYADGINLCQGTSGTDVSHCNFRSNGDDAMAVWPNSDFGAPEAVNNIFRYNTVEHTYRAAGSAIFGGNGHQVHHCIIKDGHAGSGIRLTTDFPGYHFENTTQIRYYENTIEACGTSKDLWGFHRGAIEINATGGGIQNIFFENIDIINAQRHGVQIGGNGTDLQFDNISINGTGIDPYTYSYYTVALEGAAVMAFGGNGTAVFNNLSLENIELDPPTYKANENYNLIIQNLNVPLTGISLSESQIDMAVGEAEPLYVNYSPANATNKTVIWTTSNAAIATYDEIEGKVVGQGTGTATITVTSQEGNYTAQCTVTVNAAVNITASDDQADENGGTGSFTIAISEINQNITVNYSVGGSASAGDYSASPALSGSVILTPGNPSQVITITPTDDNEFEGDETLIVTLQSGSGYQLGGGTSASITIGDNENPPCTAPVIGYTSGGPTINQSIESVWSTAPAKGISNSTIGGIPGDYSGQWRALYDASNLYVLVEVGDATRTNDSGGNWWEDDVVEIFIDGNNSKGTSYDGINDFQLGFRWNDATVHAGGNSVQNTTGINFSMYASGSGYVLEAAIPWSTIGVAPSIGSVIGFDVAVDDDDNGGTRDAQVVSIATTDAGWSNPSIFGSIYLTDCNGAPGNQPPLANAGTDQTLASGISTVNLNGSGSDPDNDPITYSWSQVSGPSATINNGSSASASVSGLADGNSYTFRLTVSDGSLSATDDVVINVNTASPTQTPYGGTPWAIPGTIEAENFDNGGEGIAYHDADANNNGGQGRTGDGVDTENCSAGGLNVGWTSAGEWLEYTVNVASAGTYDFNFRVASINSGGTFHVEFDGVNKTGTVTSVNTGAWQTWTSVNVMGVSLGAGQQVMRISLDNPNYNIDKVIITSATGNVPVTGVSVSPSSVSITAGNTQQLTATVTPANATNQSVSWSSGNTGVATVNGSGLVTGVAAGTATITVTTQDGNYTATSTITVTSGGGGGSGYRIKNAWQNTYLADGGDRVTYGATPSGSSYEWELEDVGGGHVEIKNVATGEYMHIENLPGYVQCTTRTFGWYSSRWVIEDAGNGESRIRNAWQGDNYIHVENLQGHAQHGTIYTAWASAKWVLEPVSGARVSSESFIEQNEMKAVLDIYPNPVTDKLTIDFSGSIDTETLWALYDLSGSLIMKRRMTAPRMEILRGELKSGVYMLQITSQGERHTRKVVIK